ncbi:MAG: helix-turn-helix domain-containing protein [Candidatus Dormibacteraeota bacterium]|uniref:Helix-turn-helix domain-containing protein n=1 Tax=Candidatus Nephthysia bennettiae TaxID=3127016 RepID=A0A934K4D5_9BACT|nr:helix-turn-helix domain-containing protein [Candidatus Dormibacteraeota bacterium]
MPDLRPLEEVAQLVGVHPTTIRYYLRKGWITRHRKPPLVRWQPVDLDEVIELRRRAGLDQPKSRS